MPLGKEAGNYKSKVNENDLYVQVLLSGVKNELFPSYEK